MNWRDLIDAAILSGIVVFGSILIAVAIFLVLWLLVKAPQFGIPSLIFCFWGWLTFLLYNDLRSATST